MSKEIQNNAFALLIGAAIGVEGNLFEKLNEIITPLKLGIEINSFDDIDSILFEYW